MADEQGIADTPDGYFARQETGSTVKNQLQNVGVNGRRLVPLASAPSNPEAGDLYVSDGGNYDPVSNGGNASVIVYDGSSFVQVADIGADLS